MTYRLERWDDAPPLVQVSECAGCQNLFPNFSLSHLSRSYFLFHFFSRVVFWGCTPAHSLTPEWGCYYDVKKFRAGR